MPDELVDDLASTLDRSGRAAALRAGATLLLMSQGQLAAWAVVEDGGAWVSRWACWMSWPSRSTARW